MKLFGGASGARTAGGRAAAAAAVQSYAAPKQRNPLKALAIVLAVILVIEVCYFVAVFSKNSFITKWRNIYISTAMETMSHQWLATAIIPEEIISDVMSQQYQAQLEQEGLASQWEKNENASVVPSVGAEAEEVEMTVVDERTPEEIAQEEFFEIFYEVDQASFAAYVDNHPEVLENGWANLVINEAGLDDNGTEIQTIYGEQVLGIDYPNKILLIRVAGSGYQGVLAVGKDPSLLVHKPASTLGTEGQTIGEIAESYHGILAMNASGFMDDNGGGDGGTITGYAMCDGVEYGYSFVAAGEKRLELYEDNLFYIKDVGDPVGEGTTDAVEWHPAMIVDGKDVVGYGWDGLQPRACIGQSDKYEILMLVVEGRQISRSVGITLYDCVDILLQHGCMQAMNLDGGASAMMWYRGEPIISCSNSNLISVGGRDLPTAWIYGTEE